jgi:hypothetical protein
MKAGTVKTKRLIVALVIMALSAGFLAAGIPALAAEVVTVSTQNTNPIARNLEYTTFKGVAIRGQLEAVDPDGDKLTFEVTNAPKKGAVQSQSDGSFIYTPESDRKGRDTFSYVAVDKAGGISFPATVTIKINKQCTKITYADMKENVSCYSSLLLAEKGILTGEQLGNEYFFRPEGSVSRGEFLAMCMALTGTQTLEGITRTGFSDDDSIPLWVKPYVSAALLSGIITGYKDDGGRLVFASEAPVTVAEADVILSNALRLNDVDSAGAVLGADTGENVSAVCPVCGGVPTWSCQAEANLEAVNILRDCETSSSSSCLTRAQAADLLASAVEYLEAQGNNSSLLSWAK